MSVMTFDNRITLRIDDAMNTALNRVAARRRKKPAEVGREALAAYLERTGDLKPIVDQTANEVECDAIPLACSSCPDAAGQD